jgi:hypothetical protein
MMTKKTPLACIMYLMCTCLYAQDSLKKEIKRFEYYFNGGFGFYFPFATNTNALAKRGTVSTLQFQANYKGHYFSRFFFDQYNINYNDKASQNGIVTEIDQKVQTTALGLDFGYTFDVKKFSPYAYIGAGLAMMDVPKIENFPQTSMLKIGTSTNNFLILRAGVGADFVISKLFIIYAEAQYLNIPFKTDLSDKSLQGLSIQLGFKTPFQ